MSQSPPPIAVFAYNRPDSLLKTLDFLERCAGFAGSRLHVFCDDASDEETRPAIEATRRSAANWCRPRGAHVVLRDGRRGFRNLSDGVGELCADFGCAISLDDDHESSPHLLTFLDRALHVYRDNEKVYQVAGYFPGAILPDDCPDAFFFPSPMSMAWGTWHRAWSRFKWDIAEDGRRVLMDADLRRRFDLNDRYPTSQLLARALTGDFDSYFIRWYLAMFLGGGQGLCTKHSLVRNFGYTGGIHPGPATREREVFFNGRWNGEVDPSTWVLPTEVAPDEDIMTRLCEAVRAAGITRHVSLPRPDAGLVPSGIAAS